jgi:hypothetical protein
MRRVVFAAAGERRLPGSRAERPRCVRAPQLQDRQGASPHPLYPAVFQCCSVARRLLLDRSLLLVGQVRSVVESNRPDTRNALYQQTIKQVWRDSLNKGKEDRIYWRMRGGSAVTFLCHRGHYS